MPIPTYDKLFNPVIEAIKNLGGSAKMMKYFQKSAKFLNLPMKRHLNFIMEETVLF